jgi:hypothetical protein
MTTAKNASRVAARQARMQIVMQSIADAGMAGMMAAEATQLIDGTKPRTIEDYLQELCATGRLKRAKEAGLWTYYGTEAAYKAAHGRIAANERARQTKWTQAKAAQRRAEAASKPAKVPKPKPHQALTIKPAKERRPTPAELFAAGAADYSRAKIIRIPTPPDRWAPADVVRQYERAVQALRAA